MTEFQESNQMKQTKENTKKNNTSKKHVLLFTAVIILLLILLLRSCNGHPILSTKTPTPTPIHNTSEDGPIEGTGYINEGEEYDPEAIKEKLNESQYSCNIYASNYVEFTDKDAEGEIKLKNLNNYYIQVSVLPYDNEEIDMSKAYFTSIVIGPGEEMNKIKLTKNLENLREGVQPCVLFYDCFVKKTVDGETKYVRIGNSALKVTLNMLSVE